LFDSLGEKPNSTVRVFRDEALTNETGSVSETEPSTVLVETGEARNQSYHTVQSLVKERRALIVEFKNVK
jgi:hypothetical protein